MFVMRMIILSSNNFTVIRHDTENTLKSLFLWSSDEVINKSSEILYKRQIEFFITWAIYILISILLLCSGFIIFMRKLPTAEFLDSLSYSYNHIFSANMLIILFTGILAYRKNIHYKAVMLAKTFNKAN